MKNAIVIEFECLPCFVLGAYGCLPARTSGVDRLAAGAICFEQCFATDPADSWRANVHARLADAGVPVSLHEAGNADRPVQVTRSGEVLWTRDPGLSAGEVESCLRRTTPSLKRIDTLVDQMFRSLEEKSKNDWLLLVLGSGGSLPAGVPELSSRFTPLKETQWRVPLLLRTSAMSGRSGIRRQELVHTGLLAPTLIDWLLEEEAADAAVAGSLLPATQDLPLPECEHVMRAGTDGTWAIRTKDFLCLGQFYPDAPNQPDVADLEVELFAKPEDYWDVLNIADQHPDTTAKLVQLMRAACGR